MSTRLQSPFLFLAALIAVAACAPDKDASHHALPSGQVGETPEEEPCATDADGDGYGPECRAGQDCDDADPEITDECYKCDKHAPGCPCETDGDRVACGKVTIYEDDRKICGLGGQVCEDGEWSDCILGALPPGQSQNLGPATGNCGIGNGTPGSACDPYCQYFKDDPSGLANGDGYVVGKDGITLEATTCK